MADVGEIVQMAKERVSQRWVVVALSEMSNPDDGRFCKEAPGVILYYAEHVASLQEYVGQLQVRARELEARLATLGEWQVGTVPPVAPDLKDESRDYDILIPTTGFYRHKTGEWIQHHAGPVKIAGWRESEERHG